MNNFLLDYTATQIALAHDDKRLPKMILESAQISCDAIRILQPRLRCLHAAADFKSAIPTLPKRFYQPANPRHILTQWIANDDSLVRLRGLLEIGHALGRRFALTFGKEHKSTLMLGSLSDWLRNNVVEYSTSHCNHSTNQCVDYLLHNQPVCINNIRAPNNLRKLRKHFFGREEISSTPAVISPELRVTVYRIFWATKRNMVYERTEKPHWYDTARAQALEIGLEIDV